MRRRRRQVKRMLASRRKARFEKHYGEGKSLTEEIPGEDPVSLSAYELTEGEVSTMDSEAYMLIEEDIVLEEGEQPQPLEKKPQVAEAEIAFADEEITSFERFVQLGKNGRSLMRHAPRQFIREVERLLLDFALDEMDSCTVCEHEDCTIKALTDTQLTIQLADSYLRRIVHELCTYHALKSESITSQSGHRVITVRRSARAQYNHKITVDFCLS
jgi:hypothetical protein